jgi:uncharacterized membrane-anchored protein
VVLALGVTNYSIREKEQVIATGRPILLELRPVDPRSLIQGDYMQLRYAAKTFPTQAIAEDMPRKGTFVLKMDVNNVASFTRLDDGSPLAQNEVRLRYSGNQYPGGLRIGAESFLFQEGQAGSFQNARFGILHVDEQGDSVPTHSTDELNPGPAPYPSPPDEFSITHSQNGSYARTMSNA